MTTYINLFIFFFICSFALYTPENIFSIEPKWVVYSPIYAMNSPYDDYAPSVFKNVVTFSRNIHSNPSFFTIFKDFTDNSIQSIKSEIDNKVISYLVNTELHLNSYKFFATPIQFPDRSFLQIYCIANNQNAIPLESEPHPSFNSHPCPSPDGTHLYFISDRPGGLGGTDIWFYTLQDNLTWTGPEHLEGDMNSPGDEITPFMNNEDTLYFSSNGHGGKGNFDIYMTYFENGEWQAPVPMSEINSAYDDTDFIISDSNTALFCSDRPGGKGKLDFYKARLLYSNEPTPHKNPLIVKPLDNQIFQTIETTENALPFRTVLFPVQDKLNTDDLHVINTLAMRLSQNTNDTIFISQHPITESVKELLVSKGASPFQIFVTEDYYDNRIDISGGNSSLFAPLSTISMINQPSAINLLIQKEDIDTISQWELRFNDSTIFEGSQLPITKTFSIQNFVNEKDTALTLTSLCSNYLGVFSGIVNIPIQKNYKTTMSLNSNLNNVILTYFAIDQTQQESIFRIIKNTKPKGGNITLYTSPNNEALAKKFMESFNRNTKYKGYNMISKPIHNSLNQACLQSLSLIPKDQQEFIIPISIE